MLLTVRINNNDNNNDNGIDSDEDSIWVSGNNKDIDTGSENDNAIGKVDANDNTHANPRAIDSVLDSLRVILLFLHVITNSLTFGLILF